MPASYFLNNEIGATYLPSKSTETANSRPPVAAGTANATSSSAGVAGSAGTVGGTISNGVSQNARPVFSPLSRPTAGGFYNATNINAATHTNTSVPAARGFTRGRGGRGGYRGNSSAFGRPIDWTATGSGPRPVRDEDWQPNLEAAAVMLDAPPEIRSVPATPLSNTADALPAGVNRGGGRGRQMIHPRGRGKAGRGWVASSQPSSRSLAYSLERHSQTPVGTSASKRPRGHDSANSGFLEQRVKKKKKKSKALRAKGEHPASGMFENESVAESSTAHQSAPQICVGAGKNGDPCQEAASGLRPPQTVNARYPGFAGTSEKRMEYDGARTSNVVSGINLALVQPDDMLVDDISFASLPANERQSSRSSEMELRDRSAPQTIYNGKAVTDDPPQQQKAVELGTLTEGTRDAGKRQASDSSRPLGNVKVDSPVALTIGDISDQQDPVMTTRLSNANEDSVPAPPYVDGILENRVSSDAGTASSSRRNESGGSVRTYLRDPSRPEDLDEGTADARSQSTDKQIDRHNQHIRAEGRESLNQLKSTSADTVAKGAKDAIISGLTVIQDGIPAMNSNSASLSLSLPFLVAPGQVTSSLQQYTDEPLGASEPCVPVAADREAPETLELPRTTSSDRSATVEIDKGNLVIHKTTEPGREVLFPEGTRLESIRLPEPPNDTPAYSDSTRKRPAIGRDAAAQLNGNSSLHDQGESFSLLPSASFDSVSYPAPAGANDIPQKRNPPLRRIRIMTPPDTPSRISTPDTLIDTGIDAVDGGMAGTASNDLRAASDGMQSSHDNVLSGALFSSLAIPQVSSAPASEDANQPNAAAEKEEAVTSDPVVDDVDKTPKGSGTTSFPVPANCEARNVQNRAELDRNRMDFELQMVAELENDYKRVKRVVWAADGMAFDWVLDRKSGTYREYWPAITADRTQWIKDLVRRCSALDPGREILEVIPKKELCEVKWRKGPPRTDGPSSGVASSATLNDSLRSPYFEPSRNPASTPFSSSSRPPAVPPSSTPAISALSVQSTATLRDEKEDYHLDGALAIAIKGEQMSGSQPYPMPFNCRSMIGVSLAVRNQNRADFVRRQRIPLENACRKVKRVFWRDDGLALDWELDRESGIYREYWPSGIKDDLWAASAVARWRAAQPDREIVVVMPEWDVLAITWKKAETATIANVRAQRESTPADLGDEVEILNREALTEADSSTAGSNEMTSQVDAGFDNGTCNPNAFPACPSALDQPLPSAHAVLPMISSHPPTLQTANVTTSSDQGTSNQPEGISEPDTIAQTLPVNERNSEIQQETNRIEAQLVSHFEACRQWYRRRERITDPEGRAIIQERMDKLAEQIEELMARQSQLEESTPPSNDS